MNWLPQIAGKVPAVSDQWLMRQAGNCVSASSFNAVSKFKFPAGRPQFLFRQKRSTRYLRLICGNSYLAQAPAPSHLTECQLFSKNPIRIMRNKISQTQFPTWR
ncbi:hypothetical protein DR92_4486 (plasmid) [Brucella anthropi]|nr:hypothetical protein DR92_4486 [Brucella anthropi]